MIYTVLTLLDEDGVELGLHSMITNIGEIVVLFSDQAKLDEYVSAVRHQAFVRPTVATRRVRAFGTRDVAADSLEEIKHAITLINPSLVDAVFVTDQDNDFESLLEGLSGR